MTATLPHRSAEPPDENLFGPVSRLSALAGELAEIPLGPRPAFRAELRARLVAEAERSRDGRTTVAGDVVPAAAPQPRRRHHGRRAAAVGLAVALAGGGVAAAAERSLPGGPLYPVKRFGQSVRLALDPGTGVGPSLHLVSARISDVERTVAADPDGTDAARWRAMDSALGDADTRLVQLSAVAPAQELGAALAPDRVRLDQLLPSVPAAHQNAVRQLRDTIDGLASTLPAQGTSPLTPDVLPVHQLSPSEALAAGWPIDPATLRPPVALPVPLPSADGAGAASGTAGSSHPSGGTGVLGSRVAPRRSSSTGSSSATGLPQFPLGGLPSGGTRSSSSSTGVLPSTTSRVGATVDRTVSGALGGTSSGSSGSSGTRSTGGTSSGSSGKTVGGAVAGIVGDATDTVGRLPVVGGLTATTSTR